jgi:hypothetical protein
MRNTPLVQILNPVQDLVVKLAGLLFGEPVFGNDEVKEFAARSILHD